MCKDYKSLKRGVVGFLKNIFGKEEDLSLRRMITSVRIKPFFSRGLEQLKPRALMEPAGRLNGFVV